MQNRERVLYENSEIRVELTETDKVGWKLTDRQIRS